MFYYIVPPLVVPRKFVMSKPIAKFQFNGKTFPISITWSMAYSVLPEKFDIELLSLFVDETRTQTTAQRILIDDGLGLKLCWFFLEPHVNYDWDKFLSLLDEEPDAIEGFREVFWAACINFSSPQKKGVLREMWDMMKREMRQLSLEPTPSSKLPTDSNQEV